MQKPELESGQYTDIEYLPDLNQSTYNYINKINKKLNKLTEYKIATVINSVRL